MITYIFTAIAFLLILRSFIKDNSIKKEKVGVKIGVVSFCLVMGCMIGGTASLFPQLFMREARKGATVLNEEICLIDLISIRNDDKTSASFFLGCGSINSTEYYVYFKQFQDGGIKRGMVRVSDATIYERDEQPRIEWDECDYKAHWLFRFGWDGADIKRDVRLGDYRLIVPKGTVIEKFEIK